jgi:hypothetical protein
VRGFDIWFGCRAVSSLHTGQLYGQPHGRCCASPRARRGTMGPGILEWCENIQHCPIFCELCPCDQGEGSRARWVTRKGIGEAGQKSKARETPRPIQHRIECAGLPGVQVPGLEPCPWELPVGGVQGQTVTPLLSTPATHHSCRKRISSHDLLSHPAQISDARSARRVERFLMLPWSSPSPGGYA